MISIIIQIDLMIFKFCINSANFFYSIQIHFLNIIINFNLNEINQIKTEKNQKL